MDQPLHTHGQADRIVNLTRTVSVASLLALIVLGLAWELWIAPTGSRSLALKVVPLALALVGLLKHRMHTHRWLSLMIWIYFTEGVVRATTDPPPSSIAAAAELALCLVLFSASAWHVRWRLRRPRQ